MSRISNSHNVSVVAAASTALGTLAQSMSAGTWATLSGVSNMLNGLRATGNSGIRIGYGNKAVWDTLAKKIHIMGGDHNDGNLKYLVYNATTNAWADPVEITTWGGGHAYDRIAIQPLTGRLFSRGHLANDLAIRYKDPAGSWTDMTGEPSGGGYMSAPGVPMDWWTGTMTGIGSSGALIAWNEGDSGGGAMFIYDPITGGGTWSTPISTYSHSSSGGTYQGNLIYSAVKNCAIFGGSVYGQKKVGRLNSDRTITAMTDMGGTSYMTYGWGVCNSITVADPVTGNFLAAYGPLGSTTGFFEYNPTNGVTTQLTGSRTPPSGSTGIGYAGSGGNTGSMMAVTIPEYNVTCWMTMDLGASTDANCRMHLYKHA
jgi:hypothetical protein